jgi:hypothetical protein
MLTKITGRVRGMFAGNYPENREEEQFHINMRGDQCIAQALPERAELVRMGNSYISVGTAVAPVAAMPTTTAHFSLWNGENDDGMSYIIDYVGTYNTASAAAAINIGLAAQLNLGKITNPAGAIAIKSLSGRINYRGKGNTKASVTVTNDSAWHTVGYPIVCANTANLMLGIEVPCYGRYIVPPGGMFSLASLCNAAGSATCAPWIIWHEVKMILG